MLIRQFLHNQKQERNIMADKLFCKQCSKELDERHKVYCSFECQHVTSWNANLTKETDLRMLKLSNSLKNYKIPQNVKDKIALRSLGNKSRTGQHWSEQERKNHMTANINRKKPKQPKHSDEQIRKQRIRKINEIKENGFWFTLGKHEKQLLNEQELKDSCKIQRQHLINHLGYCVDGYCLETNTVYEVYENYHKDHVERDLKRQKEIENYLKCKFIIIYDK